MNKHPYRSPCPPKSEPLRLPKVERPSRFFRGVGAALGTLLITIGIVACPNPQDTKTAANVTVKIGEDVCSELVDAGVAPDWMELACQTAGGLVKVLLPREQGRAILARKLSVDAGPGK